MILGELIDALVDLFYTILYKMFSSICALIDFIKLIFYKLCGIETVEIEGESSDLLTNLLESSNIKTVFLSITMIGIILLVVFTIIGIIKSNYAEKVNLKSVLGKAFQALIVMFIIPITIMAGIYLTNAVMRSMNLSMQGNLQNGMGTIGGQFLVTMGVDSFKGSDEMRQQIESMFISGQFDYSNLSLVKKYYDIQSMNYILGLIGSVVMLVMFIISALTFVQRIFDIVLLYIVSPVSTSTIPLDDGNRFKVWKEMLISKVLSAYGIILVMNLFFLIIPQVNQIDFFHNDFQNGVVYILFLIGGSFAVTKASRVISQLCGSQATGGEMAQMLYNIRSAFAMSRATTAVISGTIGGLVGGSDYKKLRKQGKTRGEALNTSLNSTRNQKVLDETKKKNKAKQVLGAPTRLATMPVGMLHDLSKGGIIQVGKNFMPRLKNAMTGDSLTSRAEIKKAVSKKTASSPESEKKNKSIDQGNLESSKERKEKTNLKSSDKSKAEKIKSEPKQFFDSRAEHSTNQSKDAESKK